jgi:hypothetical protein
MSIKPEKKAKDKEESIAFSHQFSPGDREKKNPRT